MGKIWTRLWAAFTKALLDSIKSEERYAAAPLPEQEFTGEIMYEKNWIYMGYWYPGAYRTEIHSMHL